MSALSHIMGCDFDLVGGTVAVVDGAEEVRQRLLRRLCTNPGDYLWNLTFGVGLAAAIGDPIMVDRLRGAIMAQVVQDVGVDATQPVDVEISGGSGGVFQCVVTYVDALGGVVQAISFSG